MSQNLPRSLEQLPPRHRAEALRQLARVSGEPHSPCTEGSVVTLARRIRQSSKPLLNKLESDFKAHHERTTGHTLLAQALRFRLGNGIWYKPDLVQFCPTMGITCFEVKGPHAFRGGFENLKVAASLYPQIAWFLCDKPDGHWRECRVLS